MAAQRQFRQILPIAQTVVAALFGGCGLWERNTVLSRSFFLWTTGWETTARYHVWPWPYKFAAVANMPAVLAGLLLSWPIEAAFPKLPEIVLLAPSLLFVFILWRWVGARLDSRWKPSDKVPWVALLLFTLACLVGALIPSAYVGYTGYLLYGLAVWVVTVIVTHVALKPPASESARRPPKL